jgi:poly(3-hydroxybutyrate) depolymerase
MFPAIRHLLPAWLAAALVACGGSDGESGPGSPATPQFQKVTCPSTASQLETRSVSVSGQTRTYAISVPTNLAALRTSDVKGVAVVVSFHDANEPVTTAAANTCWHEIGEQAGFVTIYPVALNGNWNTTLDATKPDDVAFIKAVVPAVKSAFSLGGLNNVYLTGIGMGSKMANATAIMAPTIETVAAVAGIDGAADSAVYAQPASNRPASTMGSWILKAAGSPADPNEAAQIAYWARANGSSDSPKAEAGPRLPATVYANPARPLQQVRVSTLTSAGYGGKQLSEDIWQGMFYGTYRFPDDTRTNGTLHQHRSIEEMKLIDSTKEFVAGQPRRWLTYLPSNYAVLTASGKRLPVVISLHGRNGSGKYQALTTKWHEVAEAKGFIAVFPQGNNATWGTSIANPNVDAEFIMALIEELKSRHAVDSTRIFLNGTSMGAALTNRIAVQYPLTFAAIAPCYSGHLSPASYGDAIVRTDVPLPVWQCRGGDELPSDFPGGTTGETAAQVFWRETVNRNSGAPTLQVDDRKSTQIWNNGLAEYRWQVTAYAPHFWHEGQAEKMWNEMLSKYSRTAAGALVKTP